LSKTSIGKAPGERAAARPYSHIWEHYADELRLLDLKLLQLYSRRGFPEQDPQADAFRGMYVSEDEFMRLVADAEEGAEAEVEEDGDPETEERAGKINSLRDEIAGRKAASRERGVFLPIVHVSSVFALSAVEQGVVMLALAVELDRKYERIFGFMADDLTIRLPNVGLALQLVCRTADEMRAARVVFSPRGKLAKYLLAKEENEPFGRPLLSRPFALDRRVTAFLLDTGALDEELQQVVTIHYPDEPLEPLLVHHDVQAQLSARAPVGSSASSGRSGEDVTGVRLCGPAGSGKKFQLRHAAAKWGKNLLIADMRAVVAEGEGFRSRLGKVLREALLHQACLAFENAEVLDPDEPDAGAKERLRLFREELDDCRLPVFMLSESRLRADLGTPRRSWLERELTVPSEQERLSVWQAYAAAQGLEEAVDWPGLAAKFRFTPGQIRSALQEAVRMAAWNGERAAAVIDQASYGQVRHSLERKAVRIQPRYGWDDIVLPEEQKELLRNACNQVKYRNVVYGDWGFERKLAYGKGLSMLFAGPPGTGKTMSAQVVAKDLHMELYKIDLSQVISKYIGETEKNLHEIFQEGRKSGAILFFDETDALFGKRSEVKDAHDKYANIETAYLLQKMEEYDGISVLATNLLNNIDEAFLRRINYVIKFPFPDAEYREKIWRATIPSETPLSDDVDFKWLAKSYEIAGGNIKNVVLSAAFLAAERGTGIGMRHLVHAVRHELQKSGKIVPRTDFEHY
jgi:SpoVK/Ycf46/Vps4 family AAA+-type ATPase